MSAKTFPAVSPDEASRYEALCGFSRDFIQLHIPLVIWHKQHVELYKLKHEKNVFYKVYIISK